VFVVGENKALYHRWFAGGRWSWEGLGGQSNAAPSATSRGPGLIDVAVRGANDGAVWHLAWANKWSSWNQVGGRIVGAAEIISWGGNRLDIFARGADNRLWHTHRN
jgi:hypothetical protein